jgi:hypothetical protein
MFLGISSLVYAYTSLFMIKDEYRSLRRMLSGGWTNEKLSPFLFAPAVVFAVLNFINIVIAKLLEKVFFDYGYSLNSVFFPILFLSFLSIFISRKILGKNIITVYAIISEFKNLYTDSSYIVEKSFFEERLIKLIFPKLAFNIIKDFKLIKRKYRLQSLFVYFSFIVFLVQSRYEHSFFSEIITVLLVYYIVFKPIYALYYPPLELNLNKIFFLSPREFYISKFTASFFYIFPFLLFSIIFSFYFGKIYWLLYPILFFLHIFIVYFFKNLFLSLFSSSLFILLYLFI